jgi:hypothetical protein
MLRALAALTAVSVLFLAGASQTRGMTLGKPVDACWLIAHQPADPSAQVLTVVNQANVKPENLCRVELAVEDQALQLRAAWGTPPIRFSAGGWSLYLKTGAFGFPHGEHDWLGQPYLLVWTGGVELQGWSVPFSHEVIEALVDPIAARQIYRDGAGVPVEVADPVEDRAYRLNGVYVSDFVLPSWYAGGMQDSFCDGSGCVFSDPLTSTGDGPWDQMGTLTGAG